MPSKHRAERLVGAYRLWRWLPEENHNIDKGNDKEGLQDALKKDQKRF